MGRKKTRTISSEAVKNRRQYLRQLNADRNAKKREAKENRKADVRENYVIALRDHLYGTLSFEELKPYIVLEFFVVFGRLDGEAFAKTRSYQLVSDKFKISDKTVAKLVKEYEATDVFKKSQRGIHPKTVWAL